MPRSPRPIPTSRRTSSTRQQCGIVFGAVRCAVNPWLRAGSRDGRDRVTGAVDALEVDELVVRDHLLGEVQDLGGVAVVDVENDSASGEADSDLAERVISPSYRVDATDRPGCTIRKCAVMPRVYSALEGRSIAPPP